MLADTEIGEEHGFKVINLSNLKLVFLSANTTSVDQGIFVCTKAHCRRQLQQWPTAEKPENAGKSLKEQCPNYYQMMRWLNTACCSMEGVRIASDHSQLLASSRHLAVGMDCSAQRHTCASIRPHTQW
jgi:hypothetical protein